MKQIEQLLFLISNKKDVIVKTEYNTKMNNELFYEVGRLLMALYLTSNHSSKIKLKYCDNNIYICIKNESDLSRCINEVTAEEITRDLISKSVYNIEFLPDNIKAINMQKLSYIKEGFQQAYNECINSKIRWIKHLETRDERYGELINNINMLNINDLNKQLRLLDIRFNSIVVNDEKNIWDGKDSVESYCKVLDKYIQDAVIGMGENGLELMWMESDNGIIRPTMLDNVYMGLVLSYIYYITQNKYYYQSVIQTLNPVITYFNNNEARDEVIMLIIYFINKISPYNKLDFIINKYINKSILDGKYTNNEDEVIDIILQIINDKCIEKLSKIIL